MRTYRLMKENGLLVPKNQKLRAKREAKTSKPKTQIWGMDMTKIIIPSHRSGLG